MLSYIGSNRTKGTGGSLSLPSTLPLEKERVYGSYALSTYRNFQVMYDVQFAPLVDLDRPELDVDEGKSRKRKEPHDMDADHWSLPFQSSDHRRRKDATRAVADRPGSSNTTFSSCAGAT